MSGVSAIGRVHRMGQRRPVTVTKFLMRDSIDARVHAFTSSGSNIAAAKKFQAEKSDQASSAPPIGGSISPNGTADATRADTAAGHIRSDNIALKTESFDFFFEVSAEDIAAHQSLRETDSAVMETDVSNE